MSDAFTYLACAVVSVPVARKLGLGSVLGYLIAGICIGPFILGLVDNSQAVMQFAEFGVVMMLFLIGLELKPSLLWRLKGPILGAGGLQVGLTTLVFFALSSALFDIVWQQSLAIAMILSISSTAMVLQIFNEKGWMKTEAGESGFAVLLFQDIAIIPMMAILPLLAMAKTDVPLVNTHISGWQQGGLIALLLGGIFLTGHYLIRPLFRFIAASNMREIFVAAALLLVIGVSLAAHAIGLSPALGAFLSGVVLAESEYRHELEADIEPFKGLLLGLFFISVGANINFELFYSSLGTVLSLVAALVVIKILVLQVIGRVLRMSGAQKWRFSLSLAQGGEFAFVLFAFAGSSYVLPRHWVELFTVVVALSMLITPILLIGYERLVEPCFATEPESTGSDRMENLHNPVIIAGFGRFGQVVGRLLHGHGVGTTVLEQDACQIEMLRRFKYKVFYGDVTRLDLLQAAGAEHAKLMVIAVDEPVRSLRLVQLAQKHYPHLKLMVRAKDRGHAYQLLNLGVTRVIRETFSSAADLGAMALLELGFSKNRASRAARLFKRHDEEFLREQAPIYQDELLYISNSIQYREMLRELLQEDEEEQEKAENSAGAPSAAMEDVPQKSD
ncbi:monovalent cation:proton antiporter-2 (CPA2) family protein [Dongshaea marina]|uniref:monovalent cation:proton antiporter-2 (CPA2) family protein n=1 Tax=Dongshaea marina TaxID=2047966 RepID=UPI003898F678